MTHRRYVPYSHAHYAGNLVDGAYVAGAVRRRRHRGVHPHRRRRGAVRVLLRRAVPRSGAGRRRGRGGRDRVAGRHAAAARSSSRRGSSAAAGRRTVPRPRRRPTCSTRRSSRRPRPAPSSCPTASRPDRRSIDPIGGSARHACVATDTPESVAKQGKSCCPHVPPPAGLRVCAGQRSLDRTRLRAARVSDVHHRTPATALPPRHHEPASGQGRRNAQAPFGARSERRRRL